MDWHLQLLLLDKRVCNFIINILIKWGKFRLVFRLEDLPLLLLLWLLVLVLLSWRHWIYTERGSGSGVGSFTSEIQIQVLQFGTWNKTVCLLGVRGSVHCVFN